MTLRVLPLLCALGMLLGAEQADPQGFVPLFAEEGVPRGWRVSGWADVGSKGPENAKWIVKDGILHGSEPRGTWLISEKEYGDFEIQFEFKLGERGNSGFGMRFPPKGDPAFDGLEIQMADARYNNGQDGPDKLTGSLYWAIAPTRQVYKPTEWNSYRIVARGPKIQIWLNGEQVQDVNLDEHDKPLQRHDGPAPSLKDRPRKGHIGFQELSRGGGHTLIRNARIKELAGGSPKSESRN